MDKRERQPITIKINGQKRPLLEEKKENNEKTLYHEDEMIEFKQEPESIDFERFDDDSEDFEELSLQQTAASREADEDDFNWILPELTESEDIKEYKIASVPPKKQKQKSGGLNNISSSLKKANRFGIIPSIFFAVFFAVLLGTSLGFIMLKLVLTEQIVETSVPPVVTVVEEEKDPEGKVEPGGTSSAQLAAITGYIVQGGLFSTAESAENANSTTAKLGVPTKLFQIGGQTALFVGVGDSLENTKVIGKQLNENGIEAFAKEVEFGGGGLEGLSEKESQLLKLAPSLYETLIEASTHIATSKKISNALLTSIEEKSKEWNKISEKDIKQKDIQQIKIEIDEAIKQINQYADKKDEKVQVAIQQHLLNFLSIYHTL